MWIIRPIEKGSLRIITKTILPDTRNLCQDKLGSSLSSHKEYESMVREVDSKVPLNFNFARDVIDKHAKDTKLKNKVAFYYVSKNEEITKWSFKELSDQSKTYAESLRSFGDVSRAILILPKVPEWWIFNIAAIRNGTVLMPVSGY